MATAGDYLLDAQGNRLLDAQGNLSLHKGDGSTCGCLCGCACIRKPNNPDGTSGGFGKPTGWVLTISDLVPPPGGYQCAGVIYQGGNATGTYVLNSTDSSGTTCYWGSQSSSSIIAKLASNNTTLTAKIYTFMVLSCGAGAAALRLDFYAVFNEPMPANVYSSIHLLSWAPFLGGPHSIVRQPDNGQPWQRANQLSGNCYNSGGNSVMQFTGGAAVATPNF